MFKFKMKLSVLLNVRVLLLTVCLLPTFFVPTAASKQSCRCLSQDECWPSDSEWQTLNSSVQGRLIGTVPLAMVCHGLAYNKSACDNLASEWYFPQTHMTNPSSIVAPFFQNRSCDPFSSAQTTCSLGNYVDFAINASSPLDVIKGVQFAAEHNIRLVVKATGHDFLGRSTGRGALGIWVYNLKRIEVVQYSSTAYRGSAVKLGAGVLTYEVMDELTRYGLRIVGGSCPTVAITGGYLQGGGHSLLSSFHGLAADNVLEWEVVTANGTLLTATPQENVDLYWALCGGGAGTYGVVVSATVKAFKDDIIGAGNGTVSMSPSAPDDFWSVLSLWHASMAALTDAGGAATYLLVGNTLSIVAIALPGQNGKALDDLMKPFINGVKSYNVTSAFSTTTFPRYIDFYNHYIGLPYGNYPSNQVEGGRLFPRDTVKNVNSNITDAIRTITSDSRFGVYGVALKTPELNHTSLLNSRSANAVLPAWRQTLLHLVIIGFWNFTQSLQANHEVQAKLTSEQIPLFERLTPESGAYMNEGNFQQSDWQQTFYGSNYDELRRIKRAFDPDDLFYTSIGVGSEAWFVNDAGALCRTDL